jgi:hypothetical protein
MMIELPLIISAGVVLSFAMSTLFFEMRRSRCTSIQCCGCRLERTLMTQESMKLDERPELKNPMNLKNTV